MIAPFDPFTAVFTGPRAAIVPCLLGVVACSEVRDSASEPGEAAAPVGAVCPALSGLPLGTNRLHGYFEYRLNAPRGYGASSVVVQTVGEDGLTFRLSEIQSGSDEPLGYTSEAYIHLQCTAEGLVELGRKIAWEFYTPEAGMVSAPTVNITYEPPLLLVPNDLGLGTVWDINTVRTVSGQNGTSEETISERREGVEMEVMDLYGGRDWPVLRVESSSGRTEWYAEEYGLVKGDGLVLVGSGWPGPDDSHSRVFSPGPADPGARVGRGALP